MKILEAIPSFFLIIQNNWNKKICFGIKYIVDFAGILKKDLGILNKKEFVILN
jgi:hypothetical protein